MQKGAREGHACDSHYLVCATLDHLHKYLCYITFYEQHSCIIDLLYSNGQTILLFSNHTTMKIFWSQNVELQYICDHTKMPHTYREWGKIHWAKHLWFQPYEVFCGNTFVVPWPAVLIIQLWLSIHRKTFAVLLKLRKFSPVNLSLFMI